MSGVCVGHSKAVRDVSFNNSGTQFLSAAYDRYLKLWDSETGESFIQTQIRHTTSSQTALALAVCVHGVCGTKESRLLVQVSASPASPTRRFPTASSSTQTRTNNSCLLPGCPTRRSSRYLTESRVSLYSLYECYSSSCS